MFDSHCHLTELEDVSVALTTSRAAGVGGWLSCATGLKSCHELVSLRASHRELRIALGLHPWNAAEDLAPIVALIEQSRPDALGECGLDCYPDPRLPPIERQREVFGVQLDMASELRLPLSVHCRRAYEPLMAMLAGRALRGSVHAFAGSYEQGRRLVELGWLLGVGGVVTHRGAERLRKVLKRFPLEVLLLETDCPSLPIEGVARNQGQPSQLLKVAGALAELRGCSLAEVCEMSRLNAEKLFGCREADRPGRPGRGAVEQASRGSRNEVSRS